MAPTPRTKPEDVRSSGTFTLVGRVHQLEGLYERTRLLEERVIRDDHLHTTFEKADHATAAAVADLTRAINDPKIGLIVELDKFRTEVKLDRRIIVTVLSVVFGLFTLLSPWLRTIIETWLRIGPSS